MNTRPLPARFSSLARRGTLDRARPTRAARFVRTVFLAGLVAGLVRGGDAGEFTLDGHTFTLPEGFAIRRAAGTPLVERPITAAFDDQGRLYVADSSGSNDPVQKQLEERPHRIVRLTDTDGDGVFDSSTVFADGMMFPEGTMWQGGSLYVAAPPSIWKLTDTDGDGVADDRSEWYQGQTLTGCANDLHGPYSAPDGWIYWCKGAFAEQHHTVRGREWTTRAAHIFRCRPDGTGIEQVMTGGMDNPVDVVFLPGGERVFSTTFLVHPGNGQRDGLIHAIYGGVYGKPHGVLDGHPRTGELMPVLTHFGASAPCGLTRYESAAFGPEYRDNLFTCQFNLHRVTRHALTRAGASYTSQDSDFVVSNNLDFHPTDVLEDADGSLIVVDTGGWYKLCCPTSQLWKPDVLGGIYRVTRTGAKPVDDPRGVRIAWERLAVKEVFALLSDERPAVRRRASDECAARSTTPEMKGQLTALLEAGADVPEGVIWACVRLDTAESRAVVRRALQHQDETCRQAALNGVSLNLDEQAVPELIEILQRGTPANRRAAAESLGRIGAQTAVPDLLAAAAGVSDRALEHSISYALIEIADTEQTGRGLTSADVHARRAALIAYDQIPGGGLRAAQVIALLDDTKPLIVETANWLLQRHAEWGSEVASWFRERLADLRDDAAATAKLEAQLSTFTADPEIQKLLAETVTGTAFPPAACRLALRVMSEARPREMPPVWADALAERLTADDDLVVDAVAAARALPFPKEPHPELAAALGVVAATEHRTTPVRLDALAAVPGGLFDIGDDQFTLVLSGLSNDNPVPLRSAAADVLSRATLTSAQLEELCGTIRSVSPLELDRVLGPFERSTDEQVGLKLLTSLEQAASLPSLRIDSLRLRMAKYSPAVLEGVARLETLVNVDAATQRQRIEDLLGATMQGDVRRGQAVFNTTKSACIVCHKFGYLGGTVGPDLTRIGQIRTERDLLESILFPSLSFVRSYEPVVIITTDGRVVNGLIRNETADELVIATGPNQEARVRRADIEELRPSTVSVMPAGLDKQLTPQELADLVTFLRNAK